MVSCCFYYNGLDFFKDGVLEWGGMGVKDVKLEGGRNLWVFVCD